MKRSGLVFCLFFLSVEIAFSQNWFVGASANLRFDGVENKDSSLENMPGFYPRGFNHEIGFGISPVIEYKLTDRLSLYSSIIGSIARVSYSSEEDYIDGRSTDRYSFSLTLPSYYSFSLTNISLGFYVTF